MYFLSFDFETTGLDTWKDRIVQMGLHISKATTTSIDANLLQSILLFPNPVITTISEYTSCIQFETIANFEQNCRSIVPMQKKSIEVTGITQEFVDSQRYSASDLLRNVYQFVNQTCVEDIPRILLGWNVLAFDLPFLCYEACRLTEGAEAYFKKWKITAFYDALLAARALLPGSLLLRSVSGESSYKLGNVYQSLIGRDLAGAHGGLADACAVIEVLHAGQTSFWPSFIALPSCERTSPGVSNVMDTVHKCIQRYTKECGMQQTGPNLVDMLRKKRALRALQHEESTEIKEKEAKQ